MPRPGVADSIDLPPHQSAVPPADSVAVDGVNRIALALPEPTNAFFGVPSVKADKGAAVAVA